MHLKSLTLKGFKSFASTTQLRFEPGITCVVGPNGSGKSNVVDAIAWVLGEQGAKTLRGGKMDDVIFAGTAGRPPLGRAEVTLTIDNTDGVLPIEYAEVSVTRRLFRSGESEYEINSHGCRLLDIQELLSDSGIGREMHVIVGQGQLDSVLQARPEDRRGFIEEAAGVLKHRKRKEKALRKLDAMQANLTRISDLALELRRQLKPLGRQAEVARRAVAIQAELRDARLRLLADDLVGLRGALDKEVADETAIRDRRAAVERSLATAQSREGELERLMTADAPRLARAQETWYRLSALEERFRGTARLAAERARYLSAEPEEARAGRDPEAMEREAEAIRDQEIELEDALDDERQRLAAAVGARQAAEQRLASAEKALVAAARAVADRREGLARLSGQVEAVRSRAAKAAEEIARLASSIADARQRSTAARGEFEKLQGQVGALDAGEVDLDARHETAVRAAEEVSARVRELVEAERVAERDRSTWTARRDALALGLTRKDGAGALLAAGERVPGLLGSVAALMSVAPGHEAALAAALGAVADAVAVSTVDGATAALELLKADDGGRAGLLVGCPDTAGSPGPGAGRAGWPPLPSGARWALDLVQAPSTLQAALARALDRVAVVPDLAAARALVADAPGVRAVTPEGDLLGADWAVGGSASAPSVIEVQAAVDEAGQKLAEATSRQAALAAELTQARTERGRARAVVDTALAALNESDAEMNAVAERLAQLGAAVRSATAEAERLEKARAEAEDARDRDLDGLAGLEQRLELAGETPVDEEPASDERDSLAAAVAAGRQAELEARLAVRTGEERVRALKGRADSLLRAAESERTARARLEEARARRARGAVISQAVAETARYALDRIAGSLRLAATDRDEAQQARVVREGELLALRARTRELSAELEKLTDAVHRDEVARAEQRMRIEQLETKVAEEYALDVETLVAEYGPEVAVPPNGAELAEYERARERGEQAVPPQPVPFHRPGQEKRAARAERDLALLGKVNPLALEEFAALEERYKFLGEQLEDLRSTRRDLMLVVKEVDERIHDVFRSAFEDTAREFEVVFRALFPGGEGRLLLTDPDDLLVSGVEVEARPPGKKIKRLSLLSGGERSLTAVALLVAIFRARPSPFYVMDEVEAALDDVNLGRLLSLIEQLRESSQLIVITHQKRTMEIGDALYGVSMRGDGISQVISQRLREREPA
ncbi:MAG TPA: chromosome segregation protein SMC [Mycobacteriales bacterium]|nr:chromosome segregation protein SMC [Mycobacteriales bacterium]